MKALIPILLAAGLAMFTAVAAQKTVAFPNELDGYKFFGNGKLEGIELLVSTRADIKRIFGTDCDPCPYYAGWIVSFEFFDDIWIKESSNNKGEKVVYNLDPRYLGKLRTVTLRPVKTVSFRTVSFPERFKTTIVTSTTDARGGKSRMIVNTAFQDLGGLTYELFERTNYDDIKTPGPVREKGDLVLIRYSLTPDMEKTLFVLQN